MDAAVVLALAGRVLESHFPIDAGAYRLSSGGLSIEHSSLQAELALEGPLPTKNTVTVADFIDRRDEAWMAAFLEGWARALGAMLRSAGGADRELLPSLRVYDLTARDPFESGRTITTRGTRSAEEYERAFLADARMRDHLRPTPEALRAFLPRLQAALGAVLPARGANTEIRLSPNAKGEDILSPEPYGGMDGPIVQASRNGIGVLVMLMTRDPSGEVRDIKEQRVIMVPLWAVDRCPDRAIACVTGLGRMLPRLLEKMGDDAETLMPYDILQTDALELVKPITEHDFAEVFRRRWKL